MHGSSLHNVLCALQYIVNVEAWFWWFCCMTGLEWCCCCSISVETPLHC